MTKIIEKLQCSEIVDNFEIVGSNSTDKIAKFERSLFYNLVTG